jgi:hypothetical protein
MNSFLIKIIVMPLAVGFVTLVSKKWGNNIGGIVAGLPWVAGPIILFIALEQGVSFAVSTVSGIMVGIIGWFCFCMIYILVGRKHGPFLSLLAGYLAYLATCFILRSIISYFTIFQWWCLSLAAFVLCLRFLPKIPPQTYFEAKPLRFEIPLRMIMITLFVLTITFFAKVLGPNWSGILTPFPVMTAVLAIFTHHTQGIYQVRKVYIGLFTGMLGFSLFLYAQAIFLPQSSIVTAFSLGILLDILVTIIMKKLFNKLELS